MYGPWSSAPELTNTLSPLLKTHEQVSEQIEDLDAFHAVANDPSECARGAAAMR